MLNLPRRHWRHRDYPHRHRQPGWVVPAPVGVGRRPRIRLRSQPGYLTRGGGHYIHTEKLRHTNTEAAAVLARLGRYRTVADNLRVKDVAVTPGENGDGDDGARTQRFVICQNFVICDNSEQADRDQQVRANLVAHLQQLIDGSDTWTARRRDELVGSSSPLPSPTTAEAPRRQPVRVVTRPLRFCSAFPHVKRQIGHPHDHDLRKPGLTCEPLWPPPGSVGGRSRPASTTRGARRLPLSSTESEHLPVSAAQGPEGSDLVIMKFTYGNSSRACSSLGWFSRPILAGRRRGTRSLRRTARWGGTMNEQWVGWVR